ncbi:hypothetical protein [Streptomyces sp. MBT62]|nr:hypothetical protein [Streptomyces sp. MBT62]MBK3563200.1 hypothetical protein [Streptomyces sp. MBT62]
MTGRRYVAWIYARHWISRPFYRFLGIRRPLDGGRAAEYRDLTQRR